MFLFLAAAVADAAFAVARGYGVIMLSRVAFGGAQACEQEGCGRRRGRRSRRSSRLMSVFANCSISSGGGRGILWRAQVAPPLTGTRITARINIRINPHRNRALTNMGPHCIATKHIALTHARKHQRIDTKFLNLGLILNARPEQR